jgi:BirA family transcriptional regulator, biotin operon repressor / biotin---[acetyl-CoA-carboxylase] ligase
MISIGERLTVLPNVDSTNNYAMGRVRAGLARQGDAFFAMEQTAGKGQRGKDWQSQPGANIILSVVAEPQTPPMAAQVSQQFLLSAAVALGCYDFFFALAGEDTKIKWPNDIYWRDRKAGGILIENLLAGNTWSFAIIGIGININQSAFPEHLPNPVSLRQITGKEHDVVELARQLCRCLQHRIGQWQQPAQLLLHYNMILYKRHETVRLKKGNRVFDAVIKEVNTAGQLVVDAGVEEIFDFGELEWLANG